MKKLIAILTIAIVLVGAVFATDETGAQKDELKITCKVEAVTPQFKLYGSATSGTSSTGMTEANRVTTDATATASVSGVDNSLYSASGTTIYFVIKQARDCRWTGEVSLSVSATALSATIGTGTSAITYTSEDPVISALTAQNNLPGETGDTVATRTTTPGTASVAVAYNGRAAAAADIASFSVNWPQSDVPPATYTAWVQMTYTAP